MNFKEGDMQQTLHMDQRMSQRGITMDMVDLTLEYGDVKGDKWVLNRKGLDKTIRELEAALRTAKKLRDKGGIVVVTEESALITAYHYDSKRQNF